MSPKAQGTDQGLLLTFEASDLLGYMMADLLLLFLTQTTIQTAPCLKRGQEIAGVDLAVEEAAVDLA